MSINIVNNKNYLHNTTTDFYSPIYFLRTDIKLKILV